VEKKYRNREFMCKGYYEDAAGKNKAKAAEHISCKKTEREIV